MYGPPRDLNKSTMKTGVGRGKLQHRKLTIGFDLGDRSSFYCMLDESGDVILERKVSTTAKALAEAFAKMPRSRIAMEAGLHSPWVSRRITRGNPSGLLIVAKVDGFPPDCGLSVADQWACGLRSTRKHRLPSQVSLPVRNRSS
jgi:hypothetical protein